MTYTAYVPTTGTYNISVRYSGNSADGKIKFSFGGNDKTGKVALPSTAGWQNWSDYTVAQGVLLSKGVQSIRVYIGGTKSAINLNSFSITTSTSCVATAPVTVASLKAGVKYNYYEGTWSNLPDFSKQSIVKTGTSTSIKLGNGEITNAFAYDFNGYIKLTTEGTYTFYTNSDDGSKLFIDDAEIVNNDGAHGAIEKSGSICLKAGYHKIRVQYFDKSGGKSLSISYAGPSITKQTINNLYYSDEVVTDIENAFDAEEIASIYPNPFNNTITVQLNSSTDTKIEILNTLGQIVATQFSNSEVVTLDLNHVNNGLYIVKITSDNRVITKEILKK